MDKSKIEWTDATWNVIRGCEKVSPGCAHCYAETLVNGRLRGDFATLQVLPDRLKDPVRWKRPRRIFVNSLSDLFWDQVPDDVVDRHFAVMAFAQQHQFQILTKRPDRMRAYVNSLFGPAGFARLDAAGRSLGLALSWDPGNGKLPLVRWPIPNVWLGTSTENQPMFERRISDLLNTPAAVHFLSIEPLLGPMDISGWLKDEPGWPKGPDWVIVGGESGAKARPMNPEWVRRLRDQCVAAGVPFFFKQWGEWVPRDQVTAEAVDWPKEVRVKYWPGERTTPPMLRFGKKLAGRELDGRLWDEVPKGR